MKKITRLFRRPCSFKQEEHLQKMDFFPKKSILLAEDNPLIIRAINKLLEPRGYRVTAVEDGVKALDYLKSYTCDWALLDIVLPEVDGIDLVKYYRNWEKEMNKPYVPIFGLTGYPFKKMEHICKEAGIDSMTSEPLKIF
ncbi:response regulator [Rickettsiella massiliensis]|uniref:response regulator n=1 Tax=Rickettsiella massiliensis TaxID=676517 RepID=UPI00029B04E0|nr:response regulator [Rickettsiella massiliensis]